MDSHPTALTLDKLAHGALNAEAAGAAEQHLASCARCRNDLAATKAARQHFSQFVFPRTAAALEEQAHVEAGPVSRWWWSLVLAPVAVVLFLVMIPTSVLRSLGPDPAFTVKGGTTIHVFGRRDGRSFVVQNGDALRPGDQLRFEVAPAGAHFLLVGSVDGAGHASIYVPFEGSASVAIPPDQIYVSPGSVILDDSPGPERVFVWATEAPISAATASAALSALGAQGAAAIRTTAKLPLDPPVPPLGQTSFLWEKDTP